MRNCIYQARMGSLWLVILYPGLAKTDLIITVTSWWLKCGPPRILAETRKIKMIPFQTVAIRIYWSSAVLSYSNNFPKTHVNPD